FPGKLSVFLVGFDHAVYRARHTGSEMTKIAQSWNDIALFVEVHVSFGKSRCFFPVIQCVRASIRQTQDHESTAANVSCRWKDNGERQLHSDDGIDGIASLFHDFNTDL